MTRKTQLGCKVIMPIRLPVLMPGLRLMSTLSKWAWLLFHAVVKICGGTKPSRWWHLRWPQGRVAHLIVHPAIQVRLIRVVVRRLAALIQAAAVRSAHRIRVLPVRFQALTAAVVVR